MMTYSSGLSQGEAKDELEQLHDTDACCSALLYHGDVVQYQILHLRGSIHQDELEAIHSQLVLNGLSPGSYLYRPHQTRRTLLRDRPRRLPLYVLPVLLEQLIYEHPIRLLRRRPIRLLHQIQHVLDYPPPPGLCTPLQLLKVVPLLLPDLFDHC
jgi:hypothetical protein